MEEITLEWFFRMPGLLIVGGVGLIILAIIILVVSGRSKKENKQEYEVAEKDVDVSPIKVDENVLNQDLTVNTVENNSQVMEPVVTPVVEPVVNTVPTIEPVVTPVVEPVVNTVPTIEPVVTPVVDDINKINLDNVQMIMPSNTVEIDEII